MKVSQMVEVFHAGKMVANPEFWKKRTIDVNVLMVLLSGIVGFMNMFDCSFCSLELTAEQMLGITTGITTLVGIFNAGSTMATTDKIGLTPPINVEEVEPDSVQEVIEEEPIVQEVKPKPTKKKKVSDELANDIKDLQ